MTEMQIAPTVMVPIAVLVNRDMLGMASLVQVCIYLNGKYL